MAYTETTTTSYGSNLGNSFKGIVGGIILFIAAFPILFWNESRAVKTADALEEGAAAVVSVASDTIDSANEGKLIHITGQAKTDAVLTDTTFGISVPAMALERIVEMYQWEEKSHSEQRDKLGGGTETVTTYTYSKGWFTRAIDSSSFKEQGHDNPGGMPYEGLKNFAPSATVGAFVLSQQQISNMSPEKTYQLPANVAAPAGFVKSENYYYKGANIANPQIGDVRVSFKMSDPQQPVSMVGKQTGSNITSYTTSNGHAINMFKRGTESAEAMFQSAKDSNKMMTWIIRLVCFFMMFTGLKMVFAPLAALGKVIPILGTIVGGATSVVAFLIALVCFFVAVAIAWFAARPVLGIGLLVVAAAGLVALFIFKKKKKAAAA